jgi:hypothetical protein
MNTDFHALIMDMANQLDFDRQCLMDNRSLTHPLADRARAALARYGTPAPVPVAERLPEAGDCDERCGVGCGERCGGGNQ